jgi:hypothetical protein
VRHGVVEQHADAFPVRYDRVGHAQGALLVRRHAEVVAQHPGVAARVLGQLGAGLEHRPQGRQQTGEPLQRRDRQREPVGERPDRAAVGHEQPGPPGAVVALVLAQHLFDAGQPALRRLELLPLGPDRVEAGGQELVTRHAGERPGVGDGRIGRPDPGVVGGDDRAHDALPLTVHHGHMGRDVRRAPKRTNR